MGAVRVTTAKFGGDDALSWAVFLDGRPVATGCSKSEAAYHRDQIRKSKGIK
jgi:hypothetical protein